MSSKKPAKRPQQSTKSKAQAPAKGPARRTVMWVNHLAFLAGDPSVITSFNAISSGVGGGENEQQGEGDAERNRIPDGHTINPSIAQPVTVREEREADTEEGDHLAAKRGGKMFTMPG